MTHTAHISLLFVPEAFHFRFSGFLTHVLQLCWGLRTKAGRVVEGLLSPYSVSPMKSVYDLRESLGVPRQEHLKELLIVADDFPNPASQTGLEIFTTGVVSGHIQRPPLFVAGDALHFTDLLSLLRVTEAPAYVYSGTCFDRHRFGKAVALPFVETEDRGLGLPSFEGENTFANPYTGEQVVITSTFNEYFREGCPIIKRPTPHSNDNRLVVSIRMSGLGVYGNVETEWTADHRSRVTNEYDLRNVPVGTLALLLMANKVDHLYMWFKPTKDGQGKHVTAIQQGILQKFGIKPQKGYKTDYCAMYGPQVDSLLAIFPDSFWQPLQNLIALYGVDYFNAKLTMELRDWGLRRLNTETAANVSFAYSVGDEMGDSFQDASEGHQDVAEISVQEVLPQLGFTATREQINEAVRQTYQFGAKFTNIGHLIRQSGLEIPNPIDGPDPWNHKELVEGRPCYHTKVAMAKVLIGALCAPAGNPSPTLIRWGEDFLRFVAQDALQGPRDVVEWEEYMLQNAPKFSW
jgi:hypothetical protein